MPFLAAIIPTIASIAGIAAAGTTIGETIAGSGGGGGGDAQKQLDAQKAAQSKADAEAKQKAIFASLANSQEATGGNVGPSGLVDLASVFAGLPGESTTNAGKGALAQYFGTPSPGTSTGTGTPDTLVSSTYGISGGQG